MVESIRLGPNNSLSPLTNELDPPDHVTVPLYATLQLLPSPKVASQRVTSGELDHTQLQPIPGSNSNLRLSFLPARLPACSSTAWYLFLTISKTGPTLSHAPLSSVTSLNARREERRPNWRPGSPPTSVTTSPGSAYLLERLQSLRLAAVGSRTLPLLWSYDNSDAREASWRPSRLRWGMCDLGRLL